MASTETAPVAATAAPTTIALRAPSKYADPDATPTATTPTTFIPPPLEWLYRTWTVTHSTLSMWRTARNVRITYAALPPATSPSGAAPAPARIDDLVEYESVSTKAGRGSGLKSVAGIDTASSSDTSSWDWRGKGWLFFVTSHWEILGWGERPLLAGPDGASSGGVERWAVTWFAPTVFTKEGVDIYSDRPEGISEGLAAEILERLKTDLAGRADKVAAMVEKEMRPVEILLPWKAKS